MVQTSDSRTRGANRLIQHHTNIAAYKQSFFPRTIPIAVTNTTKLEEFKASLLSEMDELITMNLKEEQMYGKEMKGKI
jgi:hypothetical protein